MRGSRVHHRIHRNFLRWCPINHRCRWTQRSTTKPKAQRMTASPLPQQLSPSADPERLNRPKELSKVDLSTISSRWFLKSMESEWIELIPDMFYPHPTLAGFVIAFRKDNHETLHFTIDRLQCYEQYEQHFSGRSLSQVRKNV